MDNVLQDMVQRLRAIELLLRTQNELITGVLGELQQTRLRAEATEFHGILSSPVDPSHRTNVRDRAPDCITGRTASDPSKSPSSLSQPNRTESVSSSENLSFRRRL